MMADYESSGSYDSSSSDEVLRIKKHKISHDSTSHGDDHTLYLQQIETFAVPLIKHDVTTHKIAECDGVIWFICNNGGGLESYLNFCRDMCKTAMKDNDKDNYQNCINFYNSVIKAAVTLVYLLFTKEDLLYYGRSPILSGQLNKLLDNFAEYVDKRLEVWEVYKKLVEEKIDKEDFSLVTEYRFADLLRKYGIALEDPHILTKRYETKEEYKARQKTYGLDVDEESPLMADIRAIINQMDLIPTMKADDYTSLLLGLDGPDVKVQERFLASVVKIIDTDALYNIDSRYLPLPLDDNGLTRHEDFDLTLKFHLLYLLTFKRTLLLEKRGQVDYVMFTFDELCAAKVPVRPPNPAIADIVRAAEVRRTAQGHRFIGRNHFIWALLKCGYTLPDKIVTEAISTMAGEEHPPYQIYETAIKLAEAFDECVQVEHFIYAVFHGKYFGYSKDEIDDMKEDFKEFVKGRKFDKVESDLSESFESYFIWVKKDNTIRQFKKTKPVDELVFEGGQLIAA